MLSCNMDIYVILYLLTYPRYDITYDHDGLQSLPYPNHIYISYIHMYTTAVAYLSQGIQKMLWTRGAPQVHKGWWYLVRQNMPFKKLLVCVMYIIHIYIYVRIYSVCKHSASTPPKPTDLQEGNGLRQGVDYHIVLNSVPWRKTFATSPSQDIGGRHREPLSQGIQMWWSKGSVKWYHDIDIPVPYMIWIVLDTMYEM